MSIRFLISGDWHLRGSNPIGRLDNYPKAIVNKIIQVQELARKYDVEAIIQAGDIFHAPYVSFTTMAELAELLIKSPCPTLSVPGNHDLWDGNLSSKPRTPFGFLGRIRLVNLHDLSEEPYIIDNANDKVRVTGSGYDVTTDTEAGMVQYEPPKAPLEKRFTIHVVHSMLLLKPPKYDMAYTSLDEVDTSADVIVCGHDHIGFGIQRRKGGPLFINPGALCRLTADKAEMTRPVQVALLTIDKGKAKAELIPLDVPPGEEVLSRKHLEAAEAQQDRLKEFMSMLSPAVRDAYTSKFLDLKEIILMLAKDVDKVVVTQALRRLAEAREELYDEKAPKEEVSPPPVTEFKRRK